jgi:hypothetical protein
VRKEWIWWQRCLELEADTWIYHPGKIIDRGQNIIAKGNQGILRKDRKGKINVI